MNFGNSVGGKGLEEIILFFQFILLPEKVENQNFHQEFCLLRHISSAFFGKERRLPDF